MYVYLNKWIYVCMYVWYLEDWDESHVAVFQLVKFFNYLRQVEPCELTDTYIHILEDKSMYVCMYVCIWELACIYLCIYVCK